MTTISSHVLDSITGHSAKNVRVNCIRLSSDSDNQPVFDVKTNDEGRISVEVDILSNQTGIYFEINFFSGDYFRQTQPRIISKHQIIEMVVVRMVLKDERKRYHVPVLISPHSHTVWWSE